MKLHPCSISPVKRLFSSLVFVGGCIPAVSHAQAVTAAERRLQLSAFVLADGTYTGLDASGSTLGGGKNIAITPGVDLRFYHWGAYSLSAEIRGTIPVDNGGVDDQKSLLGGARFARAFCGAYECRYHVFVDGLAGRGRVNYQNGGYVTTDLLYFSSTSNVFGGGGGTTWDFKPQWSAVAEAQVQHWNVPVVPGGGIWAKQFSAGVEYRLFGNRVR